MGIALKTGGQDDILNQTGNPMPRLQTCAVNLPAISKPIRRSMAQVQDDTFSALRQAGTVCRKHVLLCGGSLDDAPNDTEDLQ